MADQPEADQPDEGVTPTGVEGVAKRISRGVIAALVGGAMVVVLVAGTVVAGGGDGDDSAGKSSGDEPADRRTSTWTTVSTTTTTLAPTTTTAQATTVPPTTTARRPSTSVTSLLSTPPPPPSPPHVPEPLPPDPRPKALDSWASCSLQVDGSILATGSVKWSDGFIDTGTATFTSPGRHSLTTTHRNWVFDYYISVYPPAAGGGLDCQAPDGGGGALYWDG